MIQTHSVLALIPARGGSKGLPHKNIKSIAGKPMIAWTIEAATQSQYIDRIIISSDDTETIKIAKQFGCEAPFVRPPHLAQDNSPTIDAVVHALDNLPHYDMVVLLQPTSPLRNTEDIDNAINTLITANANSCVSVTEPDKSPYWMFTINKKGAIRPLLNQELSNKPRQQLPLIQVLNGAIYIIKTQSLKTNPALITHDTVPYMMSKERSIDVDDNLDMKLAEFLLQQQLDKQHKHYASI
ncbi:MAG: acylneuraminate cytidylyltransferase family protein [Gammaproteobacteria bacterium]|nr:acylneuraminate cytidylyltransferase family protein [Gammaproteobacteria bacterium]